MSKALHVWAPMSYARTANGFLDGVPFDTLDFVRPFRVSFEGQGMMMQAYVSNSASNTDSVREYNVQYGWLIRHMHNKV